MGFVPAGILVWAGPTAYHISLEIDRDSDDDSKSFTSLFFTISTFALPLQGFVYALIFFFRVYMRRNKKREVLIIIIKNKKYFFFIFVFIFVFFRIKKIIIMNLLFLVQEMILL